MNMLIIVSLFFVTSAFTSIAYSQEPDCEAVMSQLKEARADYKEKFKQQKKAYENWSKYDKELHSFTYEATGQPLADSAKKCKEGDDSPGKDFCKGAVSKFDEISAKEKPALEEYNKAKTNADGSRHIYNLAVRKANEMGCNIKNIK